MNRDKAPHISSINQIPKLTLTLEEDIRTLQRMTVNKDEKTSTLIDSIIYAKKKILKMIPGPKKEEIRTASSPSTLVPHYTAGDIKTEVDRINLIKVFINTEEDQRDFVMKLAILDGLPDSIKNQLKDILAIYQRIIDQLVRMKSTLDINAIVVE